MKADRKTIELITFLYLEEIFPDMLKEFEKFTNHEFTEKDIDTYKYMFCQGAIFWNECVESGLFSNKTDRN